MCGQFRFDAHEFARVLRAREIEIARYESNQNQSEIIGQKRVLELNLNGTLSPPTSIPPLPLPSKLRQLQRQQRQQQQQRHQKHRAIFCAEDTTKQQESGNYQANNISTVFLLHETHTHVMSQVWMFNYLNLNENPALYRPFTYRHQDNKTQDQAQQHKTSSKIESSDCSKYIH